MPRIESDVLAVADRRFTGLVTGRVLSGGAPVERATVTLWAATAVAPERLGEAATGADGRFTLRTAAGSAEDASLYLTATGGKSSADRTGTDNDRMALMTVLGSEAPSSVVINELTTIALDYRKGGCDG